ncbi:MAG TPA: hypothetical protein VFE12_14970 [Acetobacteraceae bacterium]|jgi:hypothetical protein|nr:hypothetical protein [Acetobacteraceae bacterium]
MFGGLLRYACLALILAAGAALAQQPAVQLFKVITAKDEVVIGLTDPGANVENLAQRLVSAG